MSITVPTARLHIIGRNVADAKRRSRHQLGLVLGLGWLGLLPTLAPAQGIRASSRLERSLDEVRRASVSWERRSGPDRRVVDQVVLVPDLPTFLEAIATWDEGHYFPILIDDVELTFKFLRAFRPARVVRYPRRAAPIAREALWDRALAAVVQAWTGTGTPPDRTRLLRGDAPPDRLGMVPPGVVVSSPESPMLAGAIALAAGRFQPLMRWENPKRLTDVLSTEEARTLAIRLERLIADRIPNYNQLGDDCDFVTLAGDWPYRYHVRKDDTSWRDPALSPEHKEGQRAFDDLVGRTPTMLTRWGFCGRLLGDATASVYSAMCSLFVQPGSALLFNKYSEREKPWSEYTMTAAAPRLERLLPVTHRSGEQASLAGWHQVLDPYNRFGLVLINSHGNPDDFNLTGSLGRPGDIPPSAPAVVLMIHSFAAADPTNPETIAGRWLANGAFVFFGSMNEPFLVAFRPPSLVTGLIAEGLPLGAVMRQSPPEVLGQPWRLLYLGDPLYRVRPSERAAPRLPRWEAVADWPSYGEYLPPDAPASDDLRLNWALKTALFRAQRDARPRVRVDLPAVLLAIRRERLSPPLRPLHDALLTDTLIQANRLDTLRARLARTPSAERTPFIRRHLESCTLALLQQYASTGDLARAQTLWDEVVRFEPPRDLLEWVTARVAALADTPIRRADWRNRLQAARHGLPNTPTATVIEAELKRLTEGK